MKRFLFLSLVVLMTSVASAQTFGTKKSDKIQMVKNHPTLTSQRINMAAPKIANDDLAIKTVAGYNSSKLHKAVKQQNSTLSPVRKNFAASSRRAASLLEEYVGYGLNKETKQNVKWATKFGTAETEEGSTINVVSDVIPVPDLFKEAGIETIPVEYEFDKEKGTVTIPAQMVLTRTYEDESKSYVLLFGALNEDGSIVLTIDEDGSLVTLENETIVYGDWNTPEMAYDDDDNYLGYNGYYSLFSNVKYYTPGTEPVYVPTPEYEPEGLYLMASISPSAYGYNNSLQFMPAYAEQSFKNYTVGDVDSWAWKMDRLKYNSETKEYELAESLSGDTQDFSIMTIGGETYHPAELVASFEGKASNPYIWGLAHETNAEAKGYVDAGFMGDNYKFSDGTYAIISRCDPANSFATYSSMGTPDRNSRKDTLSTLILYQGKPTTPFYFEGVNFLVDELETKENFALKCKIQKVTRDPDTGKISLGDVIAESDAKVEDVIQGYQENGWNLWQINWKEFYVEDEFGFSETLDYLFVEDEFAIVIEGWDNGTFSCSPMGEYDSNGNGMTTIYCQEPNDDHIYSYSYFSRLYVGFNSAIYGYLYTEDNTNLKFGLEGGEATIHVNPMLYSSDQETGDPTYRLFVESITVDGENVEEVPEWITISIANENYEEGTDYDLIISATELSEGSRSAEIVFMQEGARMKVIVNQGVGMQGDVNGDNTVNVADISAVISMMAGDAEFEGADVNGDGAVNVADISAIITIMAEN